MTLSSPHFSNERRWLISLFLFAVAVRLATLGAYPLMDNTEARYAEIARKMAETGDWVTPQFQYGVPFWSKPPLSTWLTAATYTVFGVSEFSARLSSLVVCLAVVWLTVQLAKQRGEARSELAPTLTLKAAVVLFTTPLFFISAGAVMTDPALALGTTLSMAGFWLAMTRDGRAGRVWGYAFFVGLAISLLAKGGVGVVLTLAPVGAWTLWKSDIATVWRRLPWVSGLLLATAISIPWYLLAESRTPGFLRYFIVGEHWKRFTEAGWKGDMFGTAHAQPRGMIWPLAVAATIPWCIAWAVMRWQGRRQVNTQLNTQLNRQLNAQPSGANAGWRAYLWLWMLVSPVMFTPAGNILFTYVLPGLPAFALLVAEAWRSTDDGKGKASLTLYLCAAAMPILILLGVFFVLPGIAPERSQKALVAQYVAQRTGDSERLVYLTETPQSAQFYARGKVITASSAADLDRYINDARRDFYALTPGQLNDLPERDRLTSLGHFGHYVLLRETQTGATPK